MTSITEQALVFIEETAGMAREALQEAYKALPDAVRVAYREIKVASYFTPEKAKIDARKEHPSPSGVYKLVVTPYETSPNCWGYSQGLVYAIGSDTPIAEIRRNYSSFPYLFIEGHPNGHSYLVGGQDYQGQTVIELDTGRRRDFLPETAKQGHGFCWAQMCFDVSSRMLVVNGCYWACPYEYRFFDFSNPMDGWTELDFEIDGENGYVDADDRWPTFQADGTIRCYQSQSEYDDEFDDEEEVPIERREVLSHRTFRREGLKLVLVSEEVTEKERLRREKQAESERKWKAWQEEFKATDPLYLAYIEAIKDPVFTPSDYESMGTTHDNWCPHWQGRETRWCRRIAERKDRKGDGYTIDFEWAVKTGPVKLTIFRGGDTVGDKFFEHSVEGVHAAFAHARMLLGSVP